MAEPKVSSDVKAVGAVVLAITVCAALIGEGTLSMLVSPVVILGILYMLVKAPLRSSFLTLAFLTLTLENPAEMPANGQFKSPFFDVGGLLLTHINTVVKIPLPVSGMEIMLVLLLIIAQQRRGSKIDRAGWVPTPQPLVQLAYLTFGGIAWVTLIGLYHGGDFGMALWQIDRVIHLPLVFLVAHHALRGPKDHESLARVLVGAGLVRAVEAFLLVMFITLPPDEKGEPQRLVFATSHHDSILFACAFVVLVALMLERMGKSVTRRSLMLLPILALGMWANNRRMVWVQVAAVFVTLYLITPTNRVKRRIKWVVLAASPLIIGYLAAGWDSTGGGVFRPVEIVRSVVDPQSDGSTMWREIENYDLLFTIRQFWIVGLGYGNGFWEIQPMPAVDYSLEKFNPHNSILGLWFACGILGYTAITLHWAVGAYFARRAHAAATRPSDRVAGLVCIGTILVYMIQCWGDMGLGSWTGVFIVGPAIAVAGKLAVAVGAWPSSVAAKKPAPAPVRSTAQGQVA